MAKKMRVFQFYGKRVCEACCANGHEPEDDTTSRFRYLKDQAGQR
jgi:hypothetical protein